MCLLFIVTSALDMLLIKATYLLTYDLVNQYQEDLTQTAGSIARKLIPFATSK